ncbi:hypothetical protein Emed_001624 [Eimeria media]
MAARAAAMAAAAAAMAAIAAEAGTRACVSHLLCMHIWGFARFTSRVKSEEPFKQELSSNFGIAEAGGTGSIRGASGARAAAAAAAASACERHCSANAARATNSPKPSPAAANMEAATSMKQQQQQQQQQQHQQQYQHQQKQQQQQHQQKQQQQQQDTREMDRTLSFGRLLLLQRELQMCYSRVTQLLRPAAARAPAAAARIFKRFKVVSTCGG